VSAGTNTWKIAGPNPKLKIVRRSLNEKIDVSIARYRVGLIKVRRKEGV
jgi:hypothetical protein